MSDRDPAADGIPVVDIGQLVRGENCPHTLNALRRANEEAGFVYVRNHGISSRVIRDARASAMAFFISSQTAKSEFTVSRHHRGWLATGGARMADDAPVDLKESFVWGAQSDVVRMPTDHSLRGPNQWPDRQIASFSEHATQWFECAQRLARHLLRGFALSLNVDGNFFLNCSDRPLSRASYVYYPRQSTPISGDQFGVGPHTDFGVLTVLSQDGVGGLQVENANGEWIDAPPVDDTLIVNVGDLLHRWTSGVFRSARHRVICPSGTDRLSLVLAYDPNPETVIDGSDLGLATADRSEPITCGDYLDWRFSQAFAYRRSTG